MPMLCLSENLDRFIRFIVHLKNYNTGTIGQTYRKGLVSLQFVEADNFLNVAWASDVNIESNVRAFPITPEEGKAESGRCSLRHR
jgi:hypothetical protein